MNIAKKFNLWMGIALLILCFFIIFVVYPLILILYKSVIDPESSKLTLDYFTKFFARKYYWSTLVNSFYVTVCSTIIASVIGLPMAYVLRSVKIPGSKYLNILIVISYLSPPFIGAYAWIQLLGRNGFVTQIINSIFGVKLDGIYGFAGIVLVFALQSFPLIYMYVSGALKNLDNSLNEAAESLGLTAFQRVRQIILPLVMPSLLAGSLLVFMRVFSDFGTPMLIGEGFKTFPVLIYTQFMGEVSTDDHFAASLCVIVIVITLLLFFLQRYIAGHYSYSMTALKPMEAVEAKGSKKIFAYLFVYGVTFLAMLPQLTVIFTSFLEVSGGAVYTGNFSLQNYKTLFTTGELLGMIGGTFALAIGSACIATILGTIGAIGAFYSKKGSRRFMDFANQIPVVNAEVVTGFSICVLLIVVLGLSKDSFFPLIVGHVVLEAPFVYLSVLPKLKQMDNSIYEAALDLGANASVALRKVVIPQLIPGIVSGFMLSVTLSLDDYFITTYTKPSTFDTISTYVVNATKGSHTEIKTALWALSTLIFVVIVAGVLAWNLLADRKAGAENER